MNLNEKKIDEMTKNIVKMMNGVTTVADVRGISYKQLEAIYNVGYTYYNSGRFDEAETVFKFLCMIEHTGHKYWTALGAVRQAKKNYKEAIQAYASAALFDMRDPKPHYYSAECAFLLGDFGLAENGILSLLELCPAGAGRNDMFREKALKLRAAIKAIKEKNAAGAAKTEGGM